MAKVKRKPDRPRKDFPLGAASNGQWCKKIRGKIHYFGVWSNPAAAEDEYLRVKEYLQAGRLPPSKTQAGLTMLALTNEFMNAKRRQRDSSELSPRTFIDYHQACDSMLTHFGKTRLVEDIAPSDFESYRGELAGRGGLHFIAKRVQTTKTMFFWAYKNELIQKPVRFGESFRRPSLKSMRIKRAKSQHEHGLKMLEAAEIRSILETAKPQLKAMVLLAINGALGNSDVANLPQSAIKGGWLQYPRVKTGVDRRIPLWPETLQAITEASLTRRKAKDPADAGLCFVTRHGQRWVRVGPNGTSVVDLVSDAFSKLLKRLDMKRSGVAFYALRHTFQTIAEGCGDNVAVSMIMGHIDASMAAHYRERIDDERLLKAVNHVHAWLFAETSKATTKRQAKKQGQPDAAE